MTQTVLAEFNNPNDKSVTAAVVDDGRAGYLCFYEGNRKKSEVGLAWIYNRRSTSTEAVPDDDSFIFPHDPMPTKIVASSGICSKPEKSEWALIWTEQPGGCALFQDKRPVVFEDPREESTYCAGLKSVFDDLGWRPMPPSMVEAIVAAIRPKLKRGSVLSFGPDASMKYRLELPEMPHQRIRYGKPKRIDKIKLADAIEHPIWTPMVEDEKYDEEWERPIVSQTDIDDVLLGTIGSFNVCLTITLRFGKDKYASGECLSEKANELSSIVVWNGKKWIELKDYPSLTAPVTFTTVPTIRGVKNVKFICKDLASGKARRV